MWKCHLCEDEIPDNKLMDHNRLFHSDLDIEVETWPDGEPVFYEWD